MATTLVSHRYDTNEDVARALRALTAAGIAYGSVEIVGTDDHDDPDGENDAGIVSDATTSGVALGAIFGATGGFLLGIDVSATTVWLLTTLAGAIIGALGVGLLGMVIGVAMRKRPARSVSLEASGGAKLLFVRVDEGCSDITKTVMQRGGADPQ